MTMQAERSSAQAQNGQRQQQAEHVATDPTFLALMQQDVKASIEYIPFLSKEKIKLSPNLVIKFLCRPTKAGAVCSYEQAIRFMMLCRARQLNPWEGDAFIVGYDTRDGAEFNLVTAHQSFLKRAEVHPEYDGMESGVVVKHNESEQVMDVAGDFIPDDCTLVGGWAKVHFKNRKIPTYRRLDVKTFDKGFAQWNQNKAGMICKCAEADALRSSFPNSLGGMYMDGEMLMNAVVGPEAASIPTNEQAPRRMRMEQPKESDSAPSPKANLPQAGTEAKPAPEPTAAEKTIAPTWSELKTYGITSAIEQDGIAVFDSASRVMNPQGQWEAGFPSFTINGNGPDVDLKARTMAAAGISTATPIKTDATVEDETAPLLSSSPPQSPPARSRPKPNK